MTVALRDARRQCGMGGRRDFVVTPDLVYADDTVLLGSSAVEVQKYLDHITAVGRSYGLELNFLKTILLRVRGEYDIYGADGKPLQVKSQAVFLGGLLSTDGVSALSCRDELEKAGIAFTHWPGFGDMPTSPRPGKCRFLRPASFQKYCTGLRRYGFKDQLRKLDAFFCSCLRKIAGVLPLFLSRISNTAILAQLRAIPLSQTLHKRQLMLYGKLVQKPDADFTRRVAIEPGDCRPRDWKPKRRVGRPCLRWAESVYAMGLKSFGGNVLDFHGHLNTPGPFHWRSVVSQLHCLGS